MYFVNCEALAALVRRVARQIGRAPPYAACARVRIYVRVRARVDGRGYAAFLATTNSNHYIC